MLKYTGMVEAVVSFESNSRSCCYGICAGRCGSRIIVELIATNGLVRDVCDLPYTLLAFLCLISERGNLLVLGCYSLQSCEHIANLR